MAWPMPVRWHLSICWLKQQYKCVDDQRPPQYLARSSIEKRGKTKADVRHGYCSSWASLVPPPPKKKKTYNQFIFSYFFKQFCFSNNNLSLFYKYYFFFFFLFFFFYI
jgi:hypothetical protein